MSRLLDSSELREAAELLSEIYRPESSGDSQKSVAPEEGQLPIKRSNAPFVRDESEDTSNKTNMVGIDEERTISEVESKRLSKQSEKQSVSVPVHQNTDELTAFSPHDLAENSKTSSPPLTVENQTGLDTAVSEPDPKPERTTPFAAILANQQSLKKKLEQSSPFRVFQDRSSEIAEPKSADSPATGNVSGREVTAAWLKKARNEISDLERRTEIGRTNLSELGTEKTTTTEDEKKPAGFSAFGKRNDLNTTSTFGPNKEERSVRSETLPKKPVWPWERKEEKPKPTIAIPEAKTDSTSENEDTKKISEWPWSQK